MPRLGRFIRRPTAYAACVDNRLALRVLTEYVLHTAATFVLIVNPASKAIRDLCAVRNPLATRSAPDDIARLTRLAISAVDAQIVGRTQANCGLSVAPNSSTLHLVALRRFGAQP
jgi:hypothetical protein